MARTRVDARRIDTHTTRTVYRMRAAWSLSAAIIDSFMCVHHVSQSAGASRVWVDFASVGTASRFEAV